MKKYAVELKGKVDCVAMLEARGFLLGPLMALHLNVPCVPVRKKGKLPGQVAQLEYTLEYAKVSTYLYYLGFEFKYLITEHINYHRVN